VGNATISGTIAKQVLEKMLETGDSASVIVEREGLKQTSDTGAIDAAIAGILAANADKVAQYKGGKEALFGFFVGQTMKAMQGKANPQVVNELLKLWPEDFFEELRSERQTPRAPRHFGHAASFSRSISLANSKRN